MQARTLPIACINPADPLEQRSRPPPRDVFLQRRWRQRFCLAVLAGCPASFRQQLPGGNSRQVAAAAACAVCTAAATKLPASILSASTCAALFCRTNFFHKTVLTLALASSGAFPARRCGALCAGAAARADRDGKRRIYPLRANQDEAL